MYPPYQSGLFILKYNSAISMHMRQFLLRYIFLTINIYIFINFHLQVLHYYYL